MFYDYFLKFADEAQAKSVLYRMEGAVPADPENGVEASPGYEVPNYLAIDIIGTIQKPTGQTQVQDGMTVDVMAPLEGWHANVRHTDLCPELEAFSVQPAAPVRVWA